MTLTVRVHKQILIVLVINLLAVSVWRLCGGDEEKWAKTRGYEVG